MFVRLDSIKVEINFSVCDLPPSIGIRSNGVSVEVNFSINYIPPTILVIGHSCVENYFSTNDMPPTGFPVDSSLNNAVYSSLNFSILVKPPSAACFCESVVIGFYFSIF